MYRVCVEVKVMDVRNLATPVRPYSRSFTACRSSYYIVYCYTLEQFRGWRGEARRRGWVCMGSGGGGRPPPSCLPLRHRAASEAAWVYWMGGRVVVVGVQQGRV
ncbi:hypothetical protein Pcinc_021237 [Petrolisthes cinctipes]|uniref:Uncharacterized protein n=1 Tax=Petrolisthes cinctipes TaxID=88211 RepID=A0AAE1FHZ1_PETCI|nr:hypothetical protein Pcinc_021237 [Petrolisthes cinctipes]